jgi:two-component system response regulator
MTAQGRAVILLVDDDEDYRFLLGRAMEVAGLGDRCRLLESGEEAIAYLEGIGAYSDREAHPFPDMLFLDNKMQGMGAFEVLQWMHQHARCRVTPTIVLSASGLPEDVSRAYGLGASGYISKPTHFEHLCHLLKAAHEFWSLCEKETHPEPCRQPVPAPA